MAKKFPMDLSRFKKVHSNKESTTLRHPEGHEIRIAHKAIAPEMRSQLESLPHLSKGGEADGDGESKKSFASQIVSGANRSAADGYAEQKRILAEKAQKTQTASQGSVSESQGGMIPHYATGEMVEANPDAPPSNAQRAGEYLGDTIRGAAGDALGAFKTVGAPVADFASGMMGENPSAPDAQPSTPPQSPAPTMPPQAAAPSQPPEGPPESTFDPYGTKTSEELLRGGIHDQILGNNAQAKAVDDKSTAEVAVLGKAVQDQQLQQQAYQDNLKSINEEHEALMQDIQNSHIDPTHYLGSMDTGKKITTAIGLLLGGMGSGITGGPNPAMEFLNSQINNDIDAQKANLGKKESLLSANMRHYGNMRDAMDATRASMQSIVGMQIQQAAAQSTGPSAKALAQVYNGKIQAESAGILGQMAARRTLLSGEAGGVKDPTQLVQMMVPAEHRKEVAAEIDRAQDTARMGDTILKSFDQATRENTAFKTGFGKLRTPGSVYALHQALQPTFKDLEGTVRQAAMDNTFKNITPGPGDSAHTVAQKRESLVEYLKSKASASLAKSYGIDLSKFPSTSTDQVARMSPQQQAWAVWAKQNPNDPKAQVVLKKLGIK